ncbi:hypothetical protein GCM10028784_17670 [Myceligenerans cantabricum]
MNTPAAPNQRQTAEVPDRSSGITGASCGDGAMIDMLPKTAPPRQGDAPKRYPGTLSELRPNGHDRPEPT